MGPKARRPEVQEKDLTYELVYSILYIVYSMKTQKESQSMNKKEIYLILHNIRSAHNVGSIFRTAEAAGVSGIYLSGYTPGPVDRFGRDRKDIAKSALGAEKLLPWETRKNLNNLIDKLKKEKTAIIAVEQSKKSTDYKKIKMKGKTAVILGNEVTGLPGSVLKKCDIVAEIPMKGKKESLNVSVAAGVFLFRTLNV